MRQHYGSRRQSQVPSSWFQYLVTVGMKSADTPKVPRGQILRQTPFQATDIRTPSLSEESCTPLPGGPLSEDLEEPSWFLETSKTILHKWECGLQKLIASGTGRSHIASEENPTSGSRHQGTLPDRREVSPPSGRALPEHLGESYWFLNPSETSLLRWECGLQKLTASGTGPVSGLHLLSGSRTEWQISVHLP